MLFNALLLAGTVAAVAMPAATVTGSGSCSLPASISSVIDTIPTPPADLESALSSITNYCSSPTFTGTIVAEWTSYEAAVQSWIVANSAALSSAQSACPTLGGGVPACSSGAGASGSVSTSTQKGNAPAPRATLMAGAGAVLAGMVGVLAL